MVLWGTGNVCNHLLQSNPKIQPEYFIDNNQDIQDLFQMTPYYYKSSNTAKERIKKLKNINLTSDFEICLLKKK